MPESAQSGGGELVQGVPSHLVSLPPNIEDHWTWKISLLQCCLLNKFWLRQELKELKCLFVCPFSDKLSRALNLSQLCLRSVSILSQVCLRFH